MNYETSIQRFFAVELFNGLADVKKRQLADFFKMNQMVLC